MRIIAIRPEPGFSSTIEAAAEHGLTVKGEPLFEIEPCSWDPPDPDLVDGLLIGSANAIRHGGKALELFRKKPAFVVGSMTENVARDAGFEVEMTGEGGLQSVLDRLEGKELSLLRLTGEDHVALNPPVGITLVTRIAYRSAARSMSDALAKSLSEGAIVLLHSARAAEHFAAECDRHGLNRAAITLASLGPRIAAAAGEGWARSEWPDGPNDGALLAFVKDLWQSL